MGKPGQNGGQTYTEKTKQQNIVVEEHHQPQNEMMAPQHEMAEQRQAEGISPYARFFHSIKPLPPLPLAGGPVPKEEKVGYK